MTPEEMQNRIEDLERVVSSLQNASQIDPEIVKAVGYVISVQSDDLVTAYDKSVDENGAATYTVAKVPDGMVRIGDKIFGYYDAV